MFLYVQAVLDFYKQNVQVIFASMISKLCILLVFKSLILYCMVRLTINSSLSITYNYVNVITAFLLSLRGKSRPTEMVGVLQEVW